jgi:hypothetical protein
MDATPLPTTLGPAAKVFVTSYPGGLPARRGRRFGEAWCVCWCNAAETTPTRTLECSRFY